MREKTLTNQLNVKDNTTNEGYPLDSRDRINSLEDLVSMSGAYEGMHVYNLDDGKEYVITKVENGDVVMNSVVPLGDFVNANPTAISYTEQTLNDTQKAQARQNIGAGTSNFSGSYNDLTNKPTIPDVSNKVDKVEGKGLSTNDYTDIDKTKVTNMFEIPAGASADKVLGYNNGAVAWVEKPSDGQDGADGADGEDGLSAFELAKQQGYQGDDIDVWLASLKANIGSFKFVNYDSSAESTFTTDGIGKIYTNTIDGLTAGTDTTPDIILLMNNTNGTTAPTKTFMIATQEVTPATTPATYEFVYAGDLQSAMPSNILTESDVADTLTSTNPNKPLSAKQGNLIEGKLFKYVDLTPTISDYNIDFNNPVKVGTSTSYQHYVLAVNAGESYYIGSNRGTVYYAFLSQEPQGTSGENLVFASGYSSAILLRSSSLASGTWKTAYITIPEGCTHLWVDANGGVPYANYNVYKKREDKFVTEENISFDSAKKEVLVTNGSFNRYILDGVNRWNKQTITAEDYNINGTSIGTITSYHHYLIAVQAGEVVCMATSFHGMDYKYALLTTNEGLVASAALPLVTGTTPVKWLSTTDTGWTYRFVEIPENCAYIWIDCKAGPTDSNTRCYKSSNRIAYTDVIEENTNNSLIPSVAAVKSYAGSSETVNNTNTDSIKPLAAAMGKMLDDRFKKWINLKKSYPFTRSYSIESNGKLGTNGGYVHALIRVVAGEEYIINFNRTNSYPRTLRYAFLYSSFEVANEATLPLLENTNVEVYYLANTEVPQDKYITIPEGCRYLAFDFVNGSTNLLKRAEKDNLAVQKHYQDYIKAKSDVVLKRDIKGNSQSDSFIFFSDYHVNDNHISSMTYDNNYGYSPSLINYIISNTNTKKVFFGGDVLDSPGAGFDIKYEKFSQFIRNLKGVDFYPVVGNHEWRQEGTLNTSTNSDYIKYDYNTLIKPFEDKVNVAIDANGNERPWYYFDNEAKKIRYVCLYAINPIVSSSYANGFDYTTQINYLDSCISSLDNSWRIIVVQHIVYENGSSPVYQNQQAIIQNLTPVGQALNTKIITNNQDSNKPKIVLVLSGHTHVDYGRFVDDYCFSYVITCDKADAIATDDSALKVSINNGFRLRNTIYEQAFDAIHYEPEHNLILGERIGWGRNRIIHTDVNSVSIGNTIELTATIDNIITWASLTPNIATVDSTGVVTPVAEGDATIICYTAMVNDYDENTPELEKNGYVEYFHVKVTNGLD